MNSSWRNNNTSPQSVPEITPWELVRVLESGEKIQIVDVRAPAGAEGGVAGLIREEWVHHIVGSDLLRRSSLSSAGLDSASPVVVICAHGNDSKVATEHLNQLGASARSLQGGMAAWMALSIGRELATPESLDGLVQFDRVGKEALSYLLLSDGQALIIDPPRDFTAHLRYIDEAGARLVAVADTHAHADFISGASSISKERGVPYYLHPADTIYPYDETPGRLKTVPSDPGMSIRVGRCDLAVLHTPGHSLGSVTYLLDDEAAFTGDFLFITSVGRPDLAAKTDAWSRVLWKSIQAVKSSWQAGLMIYPAHYTSQTPRHRGGAIGEPFAQLLLQNRSLRMSEESEFTLWIKQHEKAVPAAYRSIKGINVGLLSVGDREADLLENGKNECAVGDN